MTPRPTDTARRYFGLPERAPVRARETAEALADAADAAELAAVALDDFKRAYRRLRSAASLRDIQRWTGWSHGTVQRIGDPQHRPSIEMLRRGLAEITRQTETD